jgi:hypothetical protein
MARYNSLSITALSFSTNVAVRRGYKLDEQIDWYLEELSQPSRL